MTVQVIKLYSDACHACRATGDYLWQRLRIEFPHVEFREERVVKIEKLYRSQNDRELEWYDFLQKKCMIPVDEDPNLTDKEKEEYKAKGQYETSGLPTFIIKSTNRPLFFEVISGGVGEDHDKEDDEEFMNEVRKKLMKWTSKEEGLNFPDWKYRRLFT